MIATMLEKTFDFKKFNKLKLQASDLNGDPFMILLPPPNVTGSLHIGHSLCYTLQDILARYKRLRGYNVLFQPGLDHAGIVTQLLVERQLTEKGITRKELGREKFIEEIWKWKEESGGMILKQMDVLGISCDFDKLKFTMDPDIQRAVSKMFINMYNDGLIYKDRKLVNWDPKIQSAISDLEVIEKEENGNLWHIRYGIENSSESIVVATTRPETMFGDTGIAVHPDDDRYKHLIGKNAILPFMNRLIPIVADEYANPEKGTGAVKITPAHDFNDFEVGKRNNLEVINIMTHEATLNENVPSDFVGFDRFVARKLVVQQLEELGILVDIQSIKHKVPYSDRSGVIVEPYVTDQWFVDAEKLAKDAINAVQGNITQFVPKHWENLYYEWMHNIRPWCISRQIWWGHRIPVWYGEDGTAFAYETEDMALKAARKHYGTDNVILSQDESVLDTWFSSGMWPFSTLGWPNNNESLRKLYSNAVVITGFDIIFFWVARMMMMGCYAMKAPPFKHIYIHGLVRDEKGQKMSKSRGNVIDPLELCNEYGADAVRFTLAYLASPGRDVKINKASVETGRNFLTKIWNAVRFAQMSGCSQVDDSFDICAVKNSIIKWMVCEIKNGITEFENALDCFRFDDAAKAVYKLIWNVFCDWYLELIKPILQDESEDKAEVLNATSWALKQLIGLLYVIAPYISTTLYEEVCSSDIVWPEVNVPDDFNNAAAEVNFIRSLISEMRSLRKELDINPSQLIKISCENTLVEKYSDILRRMAKVELAAAGTDQGLPILVGSSVVNVFVRDLIDPEAELKKLDINLAKLTKEQKNLKGRLSNEGFISKASPDVIEEHRARLVEIEEKIGKSTLLQTEIRRMI